MRFELKAVSPDGRVESLDLHGLDQASAIQQAESRGYTVLGVRAHAGFATPWRGGQARFPLVLFSQELLVLLNAGLPLVESIETLAERERRSEFRALLASVASILRQGNSLSSALQQFPLAFPPLYVSTVQASEKTSDLAPALGRYVAYQNQLEAIRKRLEVYERDSRPVLGYYAPEKIVKIEATMSQIRVLSEILRVLVPLKEGLDGHGTAHGRDPPPGDRFDSQQLVRQQQGRGVL